MSWAGLIAAAVAALASGCLSPLYLRRAPEPTDDPDSATKTPYRALANPRFALLVGLLALVSGLTTVAFIPTAGWSAWSCLCCLGALAAAIDGATTWIPRGLTWAMGAVGASGIAAWAALAGDPWVAVRAVGGATAVGGFFYLFWRVTGGIGFADVRLMTVVGAVTAAHSVQTALWGVLCGTLLGALWGIAHRLLRGPGEFAYGPSLWAGPFIALALGTLG